MSRLVRAASAGAVALTAHTVLNLRLLRVPPADPPPVADPVSVLLPVRDEAHRVGPCVAALLAQEGVPDLEVLVLDDGSRDGTADVVRRTAGGDPRLRVVGGAPPPAGWLGKPHACDQLAGLARGTVLVFVDADVVLAPHAVASTVALLRSTGLDLVSPYPRQVALSPAERLVQPLLQWSWLTTLPLRLAERSPRSSLAAANGQLLAVDALAYRWSGGHAAVRDQVLDDIALLRAVKRSGGRGVVADGTALASCRMYDGWLDLRDGYSKSLWSATGSLPAAAATLGALGLLYVVPPLAALRGSRAGALGYAAAVAGRALVARRTGGRVWPDSLAHPVSVLALGWLTARSWRLRRRGGLAWKGRPVG
ncbi:glycosyltransferase [Vallicoccus soli]|uniref:Glycosyltransferase n=1 Tax=Vallicoccus soli TaxID=2339232 RepID=A0A3A3Z542_9ACTN|nr:glycosyltransferase family A protein [Vallicoccus soli]RJK96838.1 glycosyltransferase [Vallicoccus soli]